MKFLLIFIERPIGTTLLAVGIALAGILAYGLMPVSPLPQIEFPTISVQASLPGASPEIMATSVATPLERQLGLISGVAEMTSASGLGSTTVNIQFDLDRNINGAARDVQAAIIASKSSLPTQLPSQPTYRIVNPADPPIMVIALTSPLSTTGEMYDIASTILQQKLSQIDGVGQVIVAGSSLPAVRVDLNLMALNEYGLGSQDVRNLLAKANINFPKGQVTEGDKSFEILASDQLFKAEAYKSLILSYKNNAVVKLSDVANVYDSVEDIRNAGFSNGKPTVLLVVFKRPGSNIIETVDGIKNSLDYLRLTIPANINLNIVMDRTTTIRASLHEVKFTLVLSILLVILVIYKFLGNFRAALVPSIAVPLSLLGTFGIMYLLGYSLDNLSLMALTIATGFVVDDAVVVVENISRHIESGKKPLQAAILGASEVSFTVISMSFSLIAVFIPILLMNGIVGRLFREFSISLSISILVSMFVSLTITPMMSAYLISAKSDEQNSKFDLIQWLRKKYRASLAWALRRPGLMLSLTACTIMLNVFLFTTISKGFFPIQDTGRISGSLQAQQDISFHSLKDKLAQYMKIVGDDPGVKHVTGYVGGSNSATTNSGRIFITLKDLKERDHVSADEIINRLRKKFGVITGASLFLRASQDIVVGARQTSADFQYTLSAYDLETLNKWSPILLKEFAKVTGVVDVNTDQLNQGLEILLKINRENASRLGVTPSIIDDVLYDAFGQRQVSKTYTLMNQYHVVMGVPPRLWRDPSILKEFYVNSPNGKQVPLSTFVDFVPNSTLLVVNHHDQLPAATISFNLLPGYSLGDAIDKMQETIEKIGLPVDKIQGSFQGTAQAFQKSLASEPYLILAALVAVYIVLGILYESTIHPVTILSTLPSAGVGAFLGLMLTGGELNVIALIGILLLIGIVKKNAIMIIDFALDIQRKRKRSPQVAIYEACIMRFRPIMMTTVTALLSALPLAVSNGDGAELRKPLGISIIGGLILSQIVTLYTTPVIYLTFERISKRFRRSSLSENYQKI